MFSAWQTFSGFITIQAQETIAARKDADKWKEEVKIQESKVEKDFKRFHLLGEESKQIVTISSHVFVKLILTKFHIKIV